MREGRASAMPARPRVRAVCEGTHRSGDDGRGGCLKHKMVKNAEMSASERMAYRPRTRVEAPEISRGSRRPRPGCSSHVVTMLFCRHMPLQQSKAKLHEEDESRGQNLQGGEIHAKVSEEEGGEIRYHEVPQVRTSQDVSMSCSS